MKRIAIVHYSAPPCVGGVEGLIAAQCSVLFDLGHQVRLVVGRGRVAGTRACRVPLLNPAEPRVLRARSLLEQSIPPRDHPLVSELEAGLLQGLVGVDEVWVHNAFTMYLNPFATVALHSLARRPTSIRWVNWCEDLSIASANWPELSQEERALVKPAPALIHIAISESRRSQMATHLGIPLNSIEVIRPPLDGPGWLDLGTVASALFAVVCASNYYPVIFIPEKLLPHKNLDLAVDLAAALHASGERPMAVFSGASSPHEPKVSRLVRANLEAAAARLGVADSVVVLAGRTGLPPSRRTLRELMMLSDVVFLPSREEGFGMPILEAALLRVPVVCSRLPAFCEAGGDAPIYFDLSASAAEIAATVMSVARGHENEARRRSMRSWDQFRRQLVRLL